MILYDLHSLDNIAVSILYPEGLFEQLFYRDPCDVSKDYKSYVLKLGHSLLDGVPAFRSFLYDYSSLYLLGSVSALSDAKLKYIIKRIGQKMANQPI